MRQTIDMTGREPISNSMAGIINAANYFSLGDSLNRGHCMKDMSTPFESCNKLTCA